MFLSIVFLEICSSIAPPAMTVAGDENPPGYPVIRAHMEIPPMPQRNFHVLPELRNYEESVVAWRKNQIAVLSKSSAKIRSFFDTLQKRELLTNPSFLEFIPGMDIFEAIGEGFASGFTGGLPAQNNLGPSPVINFVVEEIPREEVPFHQISNSSALMELLKKEQMELKMWKTLLYEPMSLMQLPVNYVEDNPLPNTHIDVSLESMPIEGGLVIPDMTMPSATDLTIAVTRAKDLAITTALIAQITALLATFKAGLSARKITMKREALEAKMLQKAAELQAR